MHLRPKAASRIPLLGLNISAIVLLTIVMMIV